MTDLLKFDFKAEKNSLNKKINVEMLKKIGVHQNLQIMNKSHVKIKCDIK